MSELHGKAGEKKGDWLKVEFSAPVEMIDALTNFVTEIGAQGAFQESLEPQLPNDFPEAEWSYLKSGVLIHSPQAGLIHYLQPEASFQLIARGRSTGQ